MSRLSTPAGFSRFLAQFDKKSWNSRCSRAPRGERTRARLISEVFTGFRGSPAEDASVEEITEISNIVIPCFLFELGRRRRHIEIEFPVNPSDSAARFGLRAGPSHPTYCISSEQLVRLVAASGEELVGLCYFGDQQSREHIEAQLALQGGATPDSKTGPLRFVISFQNQALKNSKKSR